jgi:MYXO-CTERM domain-containing protein
MQFGTSGEGKVIEDRSKAISEMIIAANPPPPKSGSGAQAGSGGVKDGGTSGPDAEPDSGDGGTISSRDGSGRHEKDDGCNVARGGGSDVLSLLLLAGLALLRRRRS